MEFVCRNVYTGSQHRKKAPVPGFVDHFNEADGPLDYTEDGKAWEKISATGSGTPLFVRASGKAKLSSPSPGAYAVVDGLSADGVITQTIGSVGTVSGGYLVFRFVDRLNYLYLAQSEGTGKYRCYKYKAGVVSQLFGTAVTSTGGDVLAVTLSGASISITRNGVALGSASTADFQTATKHGIYQSSADYTGTVEQMQFVSA